MSDKLLLELGRVARERQHAETRDGRWESLTEGTLSEDARRELERLAAEDPSAAEAYEAFRPLDAEAREHIAARLERELAEEPALPAPPSASEAPPSVREAPPSTLQALPPAPEAPPSIREALPARKHRWMRLAPVWGAVAAAAAVLLLVLHRETPPMPGYTLSVSSEHAVRAGRPEPEMPRLGPGSRLDVLLRPEQAVEGAVEVRAFLLRSGEARAWTPLLQRSPPAPLSRKAPPFPPVRATPLRVALETPARARFRC